MAVTWEWRFPEDGVTGVSEHVGRARGPHAADVELRASEFGWRVLVLGVEARSARVEEHRLQAWRNRTGRFGSTSLDYARLCAEQFGSALVEEARRDA